MQLTQTIIKAICEAALFYKEDCYNPLDPESVSLCRNIDDFIQALSSRSLPGFTRGHLENCCIFLSYFIENVPAVVNTSVHRSLLVQFSEILRTQP